MINNRISLRGVFTPIVTSFDQAGDVAHDQMAANLAKWNQTGLSGYVVLGSNGEWVYLDERERRAVLENTRLAIPSDKLMIAGTAAESTRHTIRLTKEAGDIGADVAIIVNPNYYKGQMTVPVLTCFYEAVADASPIPLMIYNLPPATGMDLPADLLVGLSQHPNIVAVKDTGGNIAKMGETIRRAAPGFQVLSGSANFFYPSMAMGVTGGILALANLAPDESVALYDLFQAGELEKGRALHLRMLPVNLAITTRFGVPGLKAALEMRGYYGGPPRSPLRPLADERLGELRAILETAGLI
jgi:4-hydroxy-2-oxoglutarate aldolase